VHAQIEDWLAELSSVGRLAPGDRMPTEQDLAAWLEVSRMTLRHALANLARRGLVTRTVGRRGGTFVAESKLEQDLTTLLLRPALKMVASSGAVHHRAGLLLPGMPRRWR
jgi:GntR family transcriptional regulator